MKRMCIAALVLLLFPALVSAEMVSISELREQAEAMDGRWQKTYETPNGALEVDIPIVLPEVEAVPIATVEGRASWVEDVLRGLIPRSEKSQKDSRVYTYVLTGEEAGGEAGAKVTFYNPDDVPGTVDLRYNEVEDPPVSKTTQAFTRYFPWQLDEQAAYAEDNPATYGEALEKLRKLSEWFYPEEEAGVYVRQVDTVDRLRRSNGSLDAVGNPLKGSLPGLYSVACDQTLYGIPLAEQVELDYNGVGLTIVSGEMLCLPGFSVDYLSQDAYRIRSSGCIYPREVRYADVPLASLDDVLASIEAKIEAGHILAVHSLVLKYVLCEDQTGEFLIYPAWIMNGLYVDDPEKGLTKAYGPTGKRFDDYPEYGSYPIFAQSAEFGSRDVVQARYLSVQDGRGQRLAMPELVTWEDVK